MVATIKTSVSLPKTFCDQADILAQRLNISRNHLFRLAIENFVSSYSTQVMHETAPNEALGADYLDAKPAAPMGEARVINQGDIYWVQLDDPTESEPGIPHPYVVIQENVLNHSRISTVVACALTSNMKRANLPGNVLLEAGEANLPKQSIVEVSKVSSVDKALLGEYIGSLSEGRISQILAGMRFLQRSFFA